MRGPKTGPPNDRQVGWHNLANCVIYDEYFGYIISVISIVWAKQNQVKSLDTPH